MVSSKSEIFVSGSDLAYSFPGGEVLFNNLNFSIERGIAGIVGPNGSGKSTLLT